jgi:hypothetical protein
MYHAPNLTEGFSMFNVIKPFRFLISAINFAALMLLVILSFQAEAASSPVRTGLGAIDNNHYPIAYYQGFDGNLWSASWTGSSFQLNSLGTQSSTVGIASAVGADSFMSGYPEVYVIGTDGNLWRKAWTGSSYIWIDLGTPSSTVGIKKAIGSDVFMNGYPEAYVIGTDGNLWRAAWNGSTFVWINLGTPSSTVGIASAIGSDVFLNGYPDVYVLGTDGNLWRAAWNGSTFVWTDLGTPGGTVGIASAVGNDVFMYGYSEAYIIGTDGNLWRKAWNGSSFVWSNLGTPAFNNISIGIASAVGSDVFANGYSEIYVVGKDGNLWRAAWNGSSFAWTNLGTPAVGVSIGSAVGHTPNSGNPLVFVTGSDSNLYYVLWNGSTWNWVNATNVDSSSVLSAHIYPKYQIIGIDYAPPGSKSYVSYGGSNVRGSGTTIANTFSSNVSLSASLTAGTVTLGATTDTTQETDSSTADSISVTTSFSDTVPGPASSLGVDHDYDLIHVWLNPAVKMTITNTGTVTTANPAGARWDGYSNNPLDPQQDMDIVDLYVYQLKNPSTITNSAVQRSWDTSGVGGLTNDDYAAILAVDPFSSASYNPNNDNGGNARFNFQNFSINYTPAVGQGNPSSTYYYVANATASTQTTGAQYSYSVGFNIENKVPSTAVILGSDFKFSETFTSTNKWTSTINTTNTNTSSFYIQGPAVSDNYTGPQSFQVWRDNIYGTYMFY